MKITYKIKKEDAIAKAILHEMDDSFDLGLPG